MSNMVYSSFSSRACHNAVVVVFASWTQALPSSRRHKLEQAVLTHHEAHPVKLYRCANVCIVHGSAPVVGVSKAAVGISPAARRTSPGYAICCILLPECRVATPMGLRAVLAQR